MIGWYLDPPKNLSKSSLKCGKLSTETVFYRWKWFVWYVVVPVSRLQQIQAWFRSASNQISVRFLQLATWAKESYITLYSRDLLCAFITATIWHFSIQLTKLFETFNEFIMHARHTSVTARPLGIHFHTTIWY